MSEISIGAVGAAIIAGLVSLLGLIISKEQKVSEFRQIWIDELRKCLVSYLANINAISDAIRLMKSRKENNIDLIPIYKLLNEASHGIILRINIDEKPAKRLLNSMKKFEALSTSNNSLTPENVSLIEAEFLQSSKDLLKFEWKRVKRGEPIFRFTKYLSIFAVLCMLALLTFVLIAQDASHTVNKGKEYPSELQFIKKIHVIPIDFANMVTLPHK
ncbi:hypothetical protein [Jiella avicenniae]|uniref:Uncharacterized protein n=1 Tax=Jiella avicenniae TaxID=2907202 RepID=A0A9X1P1X5_9HYPH|nr:hypothetical protein [Jiella avicenniae]MCE7027843.1 hypothetical protein [Jiella avicenniae]